MEKTERYLKAGSGIKATILGENGEHINFRLCLVQKYTGWTNKWDDVELTMVRENNEEYADSFYSGGRTGFGREPRDFKPSTGDTRYSKEEAPGHGAIRILTEDLTCIEYAMSTEEDIVRKSIKERRQKEVEERKDRELRWELSQKVLDTLEPITSYVESSAAFGLTFIFKTNKSRLFEPSVTFRIRDIKDKEFTLYLENLHTIDGKLKTQDFIYAISNRFTGAEEGAKFRGMLFKNKKEVRELLAKLFARKDSVQTTLKHRVNEAVDKMIEEMNEKCIDMVVNHKQS